MKSTNCSIGMTSWLRLQARAGPRPRTWRPRRSHVATHLGEGRRARRAPSLARSQRIVGSREGGGHAECLSSTRSIKAAPQATNQKDLNHAFHSSQGVRHRSGRGSVHAGVFSRKLDGSNRHDNCAYGYHGSTRQRSWLRLGLAWPVGSGRSDRPSPSTRHDPCRHDAVRAATLDDVPRARQRPL